MMYIHGFGTHLPGPPVTNADLASMAKINEEWIEHFLGNKSRHLATNLATGLQTHTLADIALAATQQALGDAGVGPSSIRFVVMATATPDQLMPATVNEVAFALGMQHIPTFQMQSGCSGALQAMAFANAWLTQLEPGALGLVIGADICNKFINPKTDYDKLSSTELVNYALFGDGAGAMVVGRQPSQQGLCIKEIDYVFTGRQLEPGQIVGWRGLKEESEPLLKEDYKAIEATVPLLAQEQLQILLNQSQTQLSDINWFLPPQLSVNMTHKIIEQLKLPFNQTVNVVGRTGNNGNALPFFQISALMNQIEPGEQALLVAIESSRWLRSGLRLVQEGAGHVTAG